MAFMDHMKKKKEKKRVLSRAHEKLSITPNFHPLFTHPFSFELVDSLLFLPPFHRVDLKARCFDPASSHILLNSFSLELE